MKAAAPRRRPLAGTAASLRRTAVPPSGRRRHLRPAHLHRRLVAAARHVEDAEIGGDLGRAFALGDQIPARLDAQVRPRLREQAGVDRFQRAAVPREDILDRLPKRGILAGEEPRGLVVRARSEGPIFDQGGRGGRLDAGRGRVPQERERRPHDDDGGRGREDELDGRGAGRGLRAGGGLPGDARRHRTVRELARHHRSVPLAGTRGARARAFQVAERVQRLAVLRVLLQDRAQDAHGLLRLPGGYALPRLQDADVGGAADRARARGPVDQLQALRVQGEQLGIVGGDGQRAPDGHQRAEGPTRLQGRAGRLRGAARPGARHGVQLELRLRLRRPRLEAEVLEDGEQLQGGRVVGQQLQDRGHDLLRRLVLAAAEHARALPRPAPRGARGAGRGSARGGPGRAASGR